MLGTVVVLIAVAAPRYGADSRSRPKGLPPRRRPTPRGDLTVAAGAVRQVFQSQVPRAKT